MTQQRRAEGKKELMTVDSTSCPTLLGTSCVYVFLSSQARAGFKLLFAPEPGEQKAYQKHSLSSFPLTQARIHGRDRGQSHQHPPGPGAVCTQAAL